MSLYLNIKPV